MIRKHHGIAAAIVIICMIRCGFSQVVVNQKWGQEILSLEKCIETGLANSKSMHSALMKVQEARAKAEETKTIVLPLFKMTTMYTRLSTIPAFEVTLPFPPPMPSSIEISPSISNNYNLLFTMQQPLYPVSGLKNTIKAAKNDALAKQEDYNKEKNEFIYIIKNTYWSLYKALEFTKLLDENVELVRAHLADVQHFYEQGLAKNIEVLKVQVQLSNMQLLQIEAHNAVKLSRVALNSLIGVPLDNETQIEAKIISIQEDFKELDVLKKEAIEKRAEVKSLEHTINVADAGLKIAQALKYPVVALVGNLNLARPNQRIFPLQDKFIETWDISIIAAYDIWNWKATNHRITQAQAQLAQAYDGMSLLKDSISLEITQNYLELARVKEKISVAGEGVKQAEENYRITNERFKAGMALNSELLDAEVSLLQTKVSRTQALIDYEIAKAKLEKSMGESK